MSFTRIKKLAASVVAAVLTVGALQVITAPAAFAAAVSISSGSLSVSVDSAYPRVLGYTLAGAGALQGDPGTSTEVRINGAALTPTVTSTTSASKVDYTLGFPSIQVTVKLTIAATAGNILDFKVTEITEAGSTKVKTIELPNQPIVSVRSDQTGAASARTVAPDTFARQSGNPDVFASTATAAIDAAPVRATIVAVNTGQVAAAVSSNAIQTFGNLYVQTTQQGALKQTGAWSNTWTYRGPDDSIAELPRVRVVLTGNANSDPAVTWQDALIAYRGIMTKPVGGDKVGKNVAQQIALNFASGTQNPFLKTLDNIKKVSLLTDGLGQQVQMKGFAGQGHDSAHPDYADHYNLAAGGLTDLQKLTTAAKDYNAIVGVHIGSGAQELPAKAFRWNKVINFTPCWVWGEAQYCQSLQTDSSGPFQQRINDLVADVPNLGFIYSDAVLTADWPVYAQAKSVNGHGLPIQTEWASFMFPYSTWYAAATDNTFSINSEMIRFAYNSQMDAWSRNPLIGGQFITDQYLGYHSEGNLNAYISQVFSQNLWTKWLQNFEITRWTPTEVSFTGNVVSKFGPGNVPQITQNGALVRDGGAMFLPWDPQTQTKIYAWTPTAGSRTWTVPTSWSGVSQAKLYKLTDTGAVAAATLPVSGGQVTLTLDASTPYVLYPATAPAPAATAVSVNYGDGAIVKDGQFYTKGFSKWNRASTSGVTTGITIETDAKGLQNLQVAGANDGEVTQQLTGLQAGKTYAALAYVSTVGSRAATVKVDGFGGTAVSKTITAPPPSMLDVSNRLRGQNYQRVQVLFTPTGTTATLHLQGGATVGAGDRVNFADVRAVLAEGANEKSGGHWFTEDFEHTTQGWGPFIFGNEGEPSLWLAEKNEGYTRNTISGNFSLGSVKGAQGVLARTWPGTVPFASGHAYRVRLDYQADRAGLLRFKVKGAAGTFADFPLLQTTERGLQSAPPAGAIPPGWTDSLPPQGSAPHTSLDFTFVAKGDDNHLVWEQQFTQGESEPFGGTIDNLVIDDLGVAPAGDQGKLLGTTTITPSTFASGGSTVTVGYTNTSGSAQTGVNLSLNSPYGWPISATSPVSFSTVAAGASVSATFTVNAPAPASAGAGKNVLSALSTFTWNGGTGGAAASIAATLTASTTFESSFNSIGTTDNSSTVVSGGGFDGAGNTYSAQSLATAGVTPGSTVNVDGVAFTWPNVPAGQPNNVAAQGQTFALSAVGRVAFLGAGPGGTPSTFTLNYTDGTSSTAQMQLPNWVITTPVAHGARVAIDSTGNNGATGPKNPTTHYGVYYNTVTLAEGKTLQTITLPNNPNLHLFAMKAKPNVASPPTAPVFASDLAWTSSSNGWGPVERDRSLGEQATGDGGTIRLGGVSYAKGLGFAPFAGSPAKAVYNLAGHCTALTAMIGLDQESTTGSVGFSVVADGVTKFTSGTFTSGTAPQAINVNIAGATTVELHTNDGGNGNGNDHASWGDAKFTCS